jgi:hypothetical protein
MKLHKMIKRFGAGVLIALFLNVSAPKPVRADLFHIIVEILGIGIASGSIWLAHRQVSEAKYENDSEELKSLYKQDNFPFKHCAEPRFLEDVNTLSDEVFFNKKYFMVSINTKAGGPLWINDNMCNMNVAASEYVARYFRRNLITGFYSEYEAQLFINVLNYRSNGRYAAQRSLNKISFNEIKQEELEFQKNNR